MIAGLPLAFAQPMVLLGLLSLPVLWWLLRLIPPRPRRVDFPPTRMLFDIAPKEETPSRTPWWLTLLRLVLAALVIFAAAGPQWNPSLATAGSATPLALLIDDGWTAASTWDARLRAAEDIIVQAENDNRGVALIPLSETTRDISIAPAGTARVRLRQLKPKPHAPQRADALPMIERFAAAGTDLETIWLSDGIDLGQGKEFVAGLSRILGQRKLSVIEGGLSPAHALAAAENAAAVMTVKVRRGEGGSGETGVLRALDLKGLSLGESRYTFKAGDLETDAEFQMPVEIRNDITRVEIATQRSAGAVQLLDKRWRRRSIGLVASATGDTARTPLLASTYYLSRALNPFADVRQPESASAGEAITQFVEQKLPMMILADVGNVTGEAREKLTTWIDDGGVLVRFAGPRLAASEDDLVPVRLRRGGRILGGSLSWEQPQKLSAFSRESPFSGMAVPTDVTVTRQVLAEPDAELSEHTWATLADGTPLVTAARRGKGVVVLFHVTADTRWSDLPLSGAFVDMLKRIVSLSGNAAAADNEAGDKQATRDVVPPNRVLDGFGAFVPPPPTARPIPANFSDPPDAEHPPGFYGTPEALVAINTLRPADRLAKLDFAPLNARRDQYRIGEPQDLRGPILLTALGLLLADALLVFWLAGGIARLMLRRRPAAAMIAIALLAGALAAPSRAFAQNDDFARKASTQTHLAYVITGDAEVDRISRIGLESLTLFMAQRTSLEAGAPMGLDIGTDELAFFPLIYWPIVPGVAKPTPQGMARLDAYMKQGGTVLFDTRDALETLPGPDGGSSGPGMTALRNILSTLDIPELEPVSGDHVLTKTFFLLRDFPGRYTTGKLWVEALPAADEDQGERPARAGDGVSSIIITSNDFAGAWAERPDGRPMLPLMPGDPNQRQFALRAGVNIVMYTLTGNYKADQVHVPALLERLGQ
jgi:hypothetical protein